MKKVLSRVALVMLYGAILLMSGTVVPNTNEVQFSKTTGEYKRSVYVSWWKLEKLSDLVIVVPKFTREISVTTDALTGGTFGKWRFTMNQRVPVQMKAVVTIVPDLYSQQQSLERRQFPETLTIVFALEDIVMSDQAPDQAVIRELSREMQIPERWISVKPAGWNMME